jgi:di/tricarboxylate transporter
MLNAALLATGAMLVTGCLTIQRAWESVDWRTVVTLGAAVGLEPALTQSGLSAVFAQLLSSIGGNGAMLALTAVFMATLLATNIIGHAPAAVLMFPVALSMANRPGVSFIPFAIVLMMGASCAFINPAGFQTNLMVQGPGGYSFADYAKMGVPLTVLVAVVALLIAPVVYGF